MDTDSLEFVFQPVQNLVETFADTFRGCPEPTLPRLQQARRKAACSVGVGRLHALEHGMVEQVRGGDLVVYPGVDCAGGGAPAEGVTGVLLHMRHSLESMAQQAFVPLRV